HTVGSLLQGRFRNSRVAGAAKAAASIDTTRVCTAHGAGRLIRDTRERHTGVQTTRASGSCANDGSCGKVRSVEAARRGAYRHAPNHHQTGCISETWKLDA